MHICIIWMVEADSPTPKFYVFESFTRPDTVLSVYRNNKMSFFRKTSHLGAVILGATVGSVGTVIPLMMSLSPLSAASEGNTVGKDARDPARKSDNIPLVSRDDLELKFVQIFFRHGARTPIGCIPNCEEAVWDKDILFQGADHYCIDYKVCALDGGPQPEWKTEHYYRKNPLRGGSYKGQLTAKGMKQANDLGKELRRHYMENLGFLPKAFSPETVYTRSTNIHRTLQSLGCVLGGLYGDTISSKESAPVTLFVDENETEILYPNSGRCNQISHHYAKVTKDLLSFPGIGHAADKIAPLLDMTDEEKQKINFVMMRDDIIARLEHNIEVPHFLIPVVDLVDKLASTLIKLLIEGGDSSKREMIRFSAGPTMQYIQETLEAAQQKEISYKFHLNSCHDTTLMAILLALEAYDDIWPPLASAVIFELYQDKAGNSFVRTLYQNREKRICQSEETLLPLEKFKQLIAPVTYTAQDYADACKVDS